MQFTSCHPVSISPRQIEQVPRSASQAKSCTRNAIQTDQTHNNSTFHVLEIKTPLPNLRVHLDVLEATLKVAVKLCGNDIAFCAARSTGRVNGSIVPRLLQDAAVNTIS